MSACSIYLVIPFYLLSVPSHPLIITQNMLLCGSLLIHNCLTSFYFSPPRNLHSSTCCRCMSSATTTKTTKGLKTSYWSSRNVCLMWEEKNVLLHHTSFLCFCLLYIILIYVSSGYVKLFPYLLLHCTYSIRKTKAQLWTLLFCYSICLLYMIEIASPKSVSWVISAFAYSFLCNLRWWEELELWLLWNRDVLGCLVSTCEAVLSQV